MIKYIIFSLLYCFVGVLIGIVLRHYLDEKISFNKIFSKVEHLVNSSINCLYRLRRNRLVQFIGNIIKNCILSIYHFLKWFVNLIYKNRVAIGKNIMHCATEIVNTANGKDLLKYQIDNSLILQADEEDNFTERFAGHPYDTPSFVNSQIQEGVSWYEIQAIRLVSRYENLSPQNLTRMAEKIIQKYMKNTRKTNVDIFVKIATPTRLYFGIALSMQGQKVLLKERQNQASVMIEDAPPPLEEAIDLFSINEGKSL